jgi:hypothetical protein
MWSKYILLGSLGDQMKMWIMFGRLSYGAPRSPSPERAQSYRFLPTDCPENSSEEPMSKTIQITDNPGTYSIQ